MKDDDFKKKVKTAIKKNAEYQAKKKNEKKKKKKVPKPSSSSNNPTPSTTFISSLHDSFFIYNYLLRSSWIFDNESNIHICNRIMLHRFKKIRDVNHERLIIEKSRSKIRSYDEINISIDALGGNKWVIILMNVCYILNFMINIVTACIFRKNKCFFDDQNMTLHMNGEIKGLMRHMHRKDVLKNNTSAI